MSYQDIYCFHLVIITLALTLIKQFDMKKQSESQKKIGEKIYKCGNEKSTNPIAI